MIDQPDFVSAAATSGAQVQMGSSPFTFTVSPQTQQFAVPPGSPGLSGLCLVPMLPVGGGQSPGMVSVVGVDSGTTWLQATPMAASPVICDYSSVIDPSGVNITFTILRPVGAGFKLGVIGLERSQIVRPIHGSLSEAPTSVSSIDRANVSTSFAGFGSAQAIRVWGASLAVLPGGSNNVVAEVIAGGHILLSGPTPSAVAIGIEGGLVVTGINVTPPSVSLFGTTLPFFCASLMWSVEA